MPPHILLFTNKCSVTAAENSHIFLTMFLQFGIFFKYIFSHQLHSQRLQLIEIPHLVSSKHICRTDQITSWKKTTHLHVHTVLYRPAWTHFQNHSSSMIILSAQIRFIVKVNCAKTIIKHFVQSSTTTNKFKFLITMTACLSICICAVPFILELKHQRCVQEQNQLQQCGYCYSDPGRACVVQSAILRVIPNTAVSERACSTSPGFNNDLQQESELVFDGDMLRQQIKRNFFTGALWMTPC